MANNETERIPLRKRSWFPYAMAGCIVVLFFGVITHLPAVWNVASQFLGYFKTVIFACIIAYVMNPLEKFLERKVFKRIKKDSLRGILSIILAFVLVAVFIIVAIMVMVPQLVDSIATFVSNLDDYSASLIALIESNAWLNGTFNVDSLVDASENAMQSLMVLINNNIGNILNVGIGAGKGLATLGIALILSFYLLMDKNNLKRGVQRFMRACMKPASYDAVLEYLRRCDVVCSRYIVFNLIDSLIIGIICAVFMMALGMPYAGLVAFIVGITNLIPTFGPIIGGVIGAFVLLMAMPIDAFIFILFSVVLQFFDGYILKPRLFGSSLGVSGLWILIAVIVGGSMFGIIGMLLAIPAIAILDFSYRDYILPHLEHRRAIRDSADSMAPMEPGATDEPKES